MRLTSTRPQPGLEAFGQVAGTVFVSDHDNGTICGCNGATRAWDLCVRDPRVDLAPITQAEHGGERAITSDPVNDRLLAIPPTGPIRTAPLP